MAEELHFNRAAERLHMAQPPLSQAIRRLESALGTPLFVRTHRSVALTPAGTAFLDTARRTLQSLETGVAQTQRVAQGIEGHLTLTFINIAPYAALLQALRHFRALNPGIAFTMLEATTQEQVNALEQGRADVGFMRTPGTTTPHLRMERLLSEPIDQRTALGRRAHAQVVALRVVLVRGQIAAVGVQRLQLAQRHADLAATGGDGAVVAHVIADQALALDHENDVLGLCAFGSQRMAVVVGDLALQRFFPGRADLLQRTAQRDGAVAVQACRARCWRARCRRGGRAGRGIRCRRRHRCLGVAGRGFRRASARGQGEHHPQCHHASQLFHACISR